MNRFELIAYAMDFCSFLLRSEVAEKIKRIISFGSIARGDFDEESDIDLFIDCEEEEGVEEEVKKILRMFELSEVNERWRLKGLKNSLSLKVGKLEKWELQRSLAGNGILLYGKYEEMPRDVKYYLLLTLDFKGLKRSEKVKIWRELYGYTQRVGTRKYVSKGLLDEVRGRKIEKGVIVVPVENKDKIIELLRRYKIKYRINEIWSDTL